MERRIEFHSNTLPAVRPGVCASAHFPALDRGFIAFEDDGQVIVSPVAHAESLHRMGIQLGSQPKTGNFSIGQRRFLAYHRENVLLRSSFLDKL